jgi:glycosyltransferase involved in cell wall biosynthesis
MDVNTAYIDKINNFIEKIVEPDIHSRPNVKLSGPCISPLRLNEKNTENLSGIFLKFAEFYNTIFRATIKSHLDRLEKIELFENYKENYINFIRSTKLQVNQLSVDDNETILFDITYTMRQNLITGIPRVVTELAKAGAVCDVIPVFLFEHKVYYFNPSSQDVVAITISKHSTIIFADASWNYLSDLNFVLKELNRMGGRGIILIYDLIPLVYPKLSNENHVKAFSNWFKVALSQSYSILCISKSVAEELVCMINIQSHDDCFNKRIAWFHLGSDFEAKSTRLETNYDPKIMEIKKPYFISVGTIEPRKAYCVAIDAMDNIWQRNIDATYVIVGQYGWSQSLLKERILTHPEYGTRLFWFDSATDNDLHYLYDNALALVLTSLCEGFGLPVIEAAHNHLSAIVSDIPVFREIGGRSTQYFEVTNSQQLGILLEEALNKSKSIPDLDFLTWTQVANNILSVIKRDEYQYKIS